MPSNHLKNIHSNANFNNKISQFEDIMQTDDVVEIEVSLCEDDLALYELAEAPRNLPKQQLKKNSFELVN